MSACPACGEPLFGWLVLSHDRHREVLLRRCERCGLGVADGLAPADLPAALLVHAERVSANRVELRVPNRASVQASLGGRHWAALEPERTLYPTPGSLPRLAAAAGLEILELRSPRRGRGQGWMWQTIVNAFTFHDNFASRVRAGSLRPTRSVDRLKFGVDAVITVLTALPVALVAAALEVFAALAGRSGELVAVVQRTDQSRRAPDPPRTAVPSPVPRR
jgi:hypothetical protein